MNPRRFVVGIVVMAAAVLVGCGLNFTIDLTAQPMLTPTNWGDEVALHATGSGGGGSTVTFAYYANDVLIPGATSYLSYWIPRESGNYTLKVVATDGNGVTATATAPLTIVEGAYWHITNSTGFSIYSLYVYDHGLGGNTQGSDLLGGSPLANGASITVHAGIDYLDLLAKTQTDDHEWAITDYWVGNPGVTSSSTLDFTRQTK